MPARTRVPWMLTRCRAHAPVMNVTLSMLLGSLVATAAVAQGTPGHADVEMRGALRGQVVSPTTADSSSADMGATKSVRVTPAVIVVDPTTHTATVHLVNPTADTLTVRLTVQDTVLQPSQSTSTAADSLAASRTGDTVRPAVIQPRQSLAAWLRHMPTALTLAPHATWTLTVHVMVPSALAPGEYATYLVLHSVPRPAAAPAGQETHIVLGGTGGAPSDTLREGEPSVGGLETSTNGGPPEATVLTMDFVGPGLKIVGGELVFDDSDSTSLPIAMAKLVYKAGHRPASAAVGPR